MPDTQIKQAKVSVAAVFPMKSFLENMVIRSDSSVLVTNMLAKELWYVPPVSGKLPVKPVNIRTYDQPVLFLVETEPDVFYLGSSNLYTSHESYIHRIDMRGWQPGQPVKTQQVMTFPKEAKSVNGACLIGPKTMLVADCFAGMIWRVDLPEGEGELTTKPWLQHHSMDSDPNGPDWTQPGVNGLKFVEGTGYLYFTSTEKQLFMRVKINPQTHEAASEPEFVSGGRMADDFIIDEAQGVAYLTTHRQNTIDRVPLDPAGNVDFARNSVAGNPFNEDLIGPSAGKWGRGSGEAGRIAYFISDGGTKSPPKTGAREAKLLRIEF